MNDFLEVRNQAMIAEQTKVLNQHRRASDLLSGHGQRVGDVISLGPSEEDNYIAELIRNVSGETYWTVVVNGVRTSELFTEKEEALIRWIDVKKNGRTSDAHAWAMKILNP